MASNTKSKFHGSSSSTTSDPLKPGLRKPVFITIDDLKSGTTGLTLVVKILSSEIVLQRGRNVRISKCLVGDQAGTILFTARNDQVDILKPGASVIIRNGKIDMFKGSMRLAVDKWDRIEVTDPVTFEVKEDNNLSLVEYELVNVAE
ncbi:uncharacterized protein At4g28440-like [Rutidosis leptorrhynchoides]|uniref:uncharacterized protein At4g28440-like n=1 Tax=Rutidosis leptorrhynchoides TaxID=125765 RepID=UPI003A99DE05